MGTISHHLSQDNSLCYNTCMSNEDRVKYWLDSAKETNDIAQESYNNTHYDWAFFQWHLALEKLLKGLIARREETPLPVHDLVKLSVAAKITLSKQQREQLDEITTYSIDARYDDYKRSFYKKVTQKDYREKWHSLCQEVFLWLTNMY